MTLVTISASYGAGGSRIAPALAERLGVPFLGRPPAPDVVEPGRGGACVRRVGRLRPGPPALAHGLARAWPGARRPG